MKFSAGGCTRDFILYIILYSYNISNIIFSSENVSSKGEIFYLGLHQGLLELAEGKSGPCELCVNT